MTTTARLIINRIKMSATTKVHTFWMFVFVILISLSMTDAFECPDSCQCHVTDKHHQVANCSSLELLQKSASIKNAGIDILHVQHAHINKINGQFDKFTNISHLDLSYNKIKSLNKLPKRLLNLDLNHNKLESIDASLLPPSIEIIDFSYNIIKELSWDLTLLHHLYIIRLQNNPLNCSCGNLRVRDWMQKHRINTDAITCQTVNLQTVSWLRVKIADVCPNVKHIKLSSDDDLMLGDEPVQLGEAWEGSGNAETDDLESEFLPTDGEDKHEIDRSKVENDFDGSGDFIFDDIKGLGTTDGIANTSTSPEPSVDPISAPDVTTPSSEVTIVTLGLEEGSGYDESVSVMTTTVEPSTVISETEKTTEEEYDEDEDDNEGSGSGGGIFVVPALIPDDEDSVHTVTSVEPTTEQKELLTTEASIGRNFFGGFSNWGDDLSEESEPDKLEDIFDDEDEEPITPPYFPNLFESKSADNQDEITEEVKEETLTTVAPSLIPVVEPEIVKIEAPKQETEVLPVSTTSDGDNKAEISNENTANVTAADPKQGSTSTYICLGVLGVLLVALMGYAALRNMKNRSRRKNRRDPENPGTELSPMHKNLLGKPLVDNGTKNGNPESVPLVGNGDSALHPKPMPRNFIEIPLNGHADEPKEVENPVKSPYDTPKKPTRVKENDSKPAEVHKPLQPSDPSNDDVFLPNDSKTSVNDSTVATDGDKSSDATKYSPVYSGDTGRVRIKMTTIPDSMPKSPMFITRSRSNAGDIVLTPTSGPKFDKS